MSTTALDAVRRPPGFVEVNVRHTDCCTKLGHIKSVKVSLGKGTSTLSQSREACFIQLQGGVEE